MMELKPINYKEEIVITTKTLADVYECKELQIQQNYSNNKDKFKEGKHYFKVEGKELKELKNRLDDFEVVTGYGKRTSCIYLWTKRGASRHCKMLGTDKAWEMFDSLEENYFNPKLQLTRKEELLLKLFSKDPMEVAKAHEELVELEKQPLLETIEIQKPKVNYFDTFMNSQGCYTSTQVAKLFKLSSARKLNTILNENKIIYKQGNNWLPYSTTNKEWFKVTIGEKNTHNYSQLKFTPKGIYELSKLLNITLNEEDLQKITNDK